MAAGSAGRASRSLVKVMWSRKMLEHDELFGLELGFRQVVDRAARQARARWRVRSTCNRVSGLTRGRGLCV